MKLEDRNHLADLLKRAAAQTISEAEFWAQINALSERVTEPVIKVALESATHYWGNFHRSSVLFFIPAKPNRGQLEQGKNELNLIAEAVEAEWDLPHLEERLKDI
jgi:hypothetical protein